MTLRSLSFQTCKSSCGSMAGAQEIGKRRDWVGTGGPSRAGLVDYGSVSDCFLGAKGRDLIG